MYGGFQSVKAMAAMAALSLTVERLRTLWSSEKSMAAGRAPPVLMVEPLPVLSLTVEPAYASSPSPSPLLNSRAPKGDGGQSSLLTHPLLSLSLMVEYLKVPSLWSSLLKHP